MSEIQAKLLEKLRAQIARLERTDAEQSAEHDERAETIAQLERDIEAERDNATSLRKTIDEQQFRMEVLEQSYSKQLDDARARAEKAETALEAEKARASELEAARDALTAERNAAQKELDRATQRERGQIAVPASPDPRAAAAPRAPAPSAESDDEGPSIDTILAAANLVDPLDQAQARPSFNGPSASDPEQESDQAVEDMLSPDLVFGGGDDAADA